MKTVWTNRYVFVRIFILTLLLNLPAAAQFKVVGYYPTYAGGYPNGINAIDLSNVTHVYIAFANPDATGNLSPDFGTAANLTTVVNAVHAQGKKVFLSIAGGAASGTNYQILLGNATNRTTFVSKIVAYANAYNLDGIDVDIEGNILNGTTVTAAQYEAFVTALGLSLHSSGKVMTAALGSWFGNLVTNTAAAQFDWINMMSYDLYGPWTGAGQHSPYSMAVSDFQYWNSTKGVPASKLVVGVPFYGYGWGSLANAGITYCNIVNTYPGAQNSDQVGTGSNIITYNGIATIQQKTTYALNNAGGLMIWELTQDCATSDSRSLLRAIGQVLGTLPLTWLSVEAVAQGASVALTWSTAEEKDNDHFEVESSMDGKTFYTLQKINTSVTSTAVNTYTYTDHAPLSTRVYYRIRQVDHNGNFSFSPVKTVSLPSDASAEWEVYPNPVTEEQIHLRFHGNPAIQTLTLTDVMGTVYYAQTFKAVFEGSDFQISADRLPSGIYLLTATGQGRIYKVKVLVQ